MKDINCNVIKDLLPLYIDNIVSEDTRKLVEEHLENCKDCRVEKELLEEKIAIPIDKNKMPLKKFKKVLRNKKIMISLISIILTATVLLASFSLVFNYQIYRPYSNGLISIETMEDGTLGSRFKDNKYYSVFAAPVILEIDGVERNIVFIYYSHTISSKYLDGFIDKILSRNKDRNELVGSFPLGNKEEIDYIYYMNEPLKTIDFDTDWEKILNNSTLIWENN